MEDGKTSKKTRIVFRTTAWVGVLGAILILFPQYLPLLWGNMKVYVTSYFYRQHGKTSVASSWTLAACIFGMNFGVMAAPYVKFIGKKTILFISIAVFNTALICMYFALENGLTLLLFALFGIAGTCTGLCEVLLFKILSDIAGSSKGRYNSMACSGFNFGPFVINLLIGLYMNPDNIKPTKFVDDQPIFDQKDLVDRVPSLIIIQGISSFLCMCLGYCLLMFSLKASTRTNTDAIVYRTFPNENGCVHIEKGASSSGDRNQKTANENGTKDMTSNPIDSKTISASSASTNGTIPSTNPDERNNDCDSNKGDMTVLDIMKCARFYPLFFSFGINIFPKILLNDSYKTYDLTYTNDDHFLINLGSAYSVFGGVVRLGWGFILDRFPIKNCLVFTYTFLSLAVFLMFFAAPVNKYLYFVAVMAVSAGESQVLPSFIVASAVYFGQNNFYKAYGLIALSRVPTSLTLSPIFELLQSSYGWFGPFCCSASFVTIALISILVIIPDIPKKEE